MPDERQQSHPPKAKIGRRLFHAGAGCLPPVLGLLLPRGTLLLVVGIMAAMIVVAEGLRLAVPQVNRRLASLFAPASGAFKPREAARPIGTTYFLVGAFLAFLFFAQPAAIAGLFFAAIGDAVAAMVGERYGKVRLGRRSLEGSAAFFGSACAAGALMIVFGMPLTWIAIVIGALVATFVELLPLPIDDNLTVPLASAAAIALLL